MPEQWRLRVHDTPPVIETDGGTERWALIFLVVMAGGFAIALPLVPILSRGSLPGWVRHGHVAYIAIAALGAAVAVVAAAATVWALRRAWRMGIRIDDGGVTINNLLRSYQLGWHEVSHFQDGAGVAKEGTPSWALSVALHDGRAIVAYGTWASAMTFAALADAARRYGITSQLTGAPTPGTRRRHPQHSQ